MLYMDQVKELCLIILSSIVAFFNYINFPFRCFAKSSLNIETYDAVVEYKQLGWARKKAYQLVLILNNLFFYNEDQEAPLLQNPLA